MGAGVCGGRGDHDRDRLIDRFDPIEVCFVFVFVLFSRVFCVISYILRGVLYSTTNSAYLQLLLAVGVALLLNTCARFVCEYLFLEGKRARNGGGGFYCYSGCVPFHCFLV